MGIISFFSKILNVNDKSRKVATEVKKPQGKPVPKQATIHKTIDHLLVEEAKDQLKQISTEEVLAKMKNLNPTFASTAFLESETIERFDVLHTDFSYTTANIYSYHMEIPIYPSLKQKLVEICNKKENKTHVQPLEEAIKNGKYFFKIGHKLVAYTPVDFDLQDGNVSKIQREYILPTSNIHKCSKCYGGGYLECPECNGKHEWTCDKCKGDKRIKCEVCKTKGEVECDECDGKRVVICKACKGKGDSLCSKCHGQGEYKCPDCNGRGEVKCKRCYGQGFYSWGEHERCKECSGRGWIPCATCARKGIVKCEKCYGHGSIECDKCSGKGEIECSKCRGKGHITCKKCDGYGEYSCPKCDGNGTIVCDTCFGTKEHYGKIICGECEATGAIADIDYISFDVDTHRSVLLQHSEKMRNIANEIKKHIIKRDPIVVYKNTNGVIYEDIDGFTKDILDNLENKFEISRTQSPLVVNESVNYQIVPSLFFKCKHMVTGEQTMVALIDVFRSPQLIIIGSKIGKPTSDSQRFLRKIKESLGKLFKTKTYKARVDKKNEMKLLIRLIRSDNVISEDEKMIMLQFGGIGELTYKEQVEVLEFLNSKELPPLNKEDVFFYDDNLKKNIITRLKVAVKIDGTESDVESHLINEIAALL